jgi:hypothetical protein
MLCSVAASAAKTQPHNPPVTFPRLISHAPGRGFAVTAANGVFEAYNYDFTYLISKFNNIINVTCKHQRQRAAAVVVRFVEGSVRRMAIRTTPIEQRSVMDRGVRLGLGRELERAHRTTHSAGHSAISCSAVSCSLPLPPHIRTRQTLLNAVCFNTLEKENWIPVPTNAICHTCAVALKLKTVSYFMQSFSPVVNTTGQGPAPPPLSSCPQQPAPAPPPGHHRWDESARGRPAP